MHLSMRGSGGSVSGVPTPASGLVASASDGTYRAVDEWLAASMTSRSRPARPRPGARRVSATNSGENCSASTGLAVWSTSLQGVRRHQEGEESARCMSGVHEVSSCPDNCVPHNAEVDRRWMPLEAARAAKWLSERNLPLHDSGRSSTRCSPCSGADEGRHVRSDGVVVVPPTGPVGSPRTSDGDKGSHGRQHAAGPTSQQSPCRWSVEAKPIAGSVATVAGELGRVPARTVEGGGGVVVNRTERGRAQLSPTVPQCRAGDDGAAIGELAPSASAHLERAIPGCCG